jgi:hypothetical protein
MSITIANIRNGAVKIGDQHVFLIDRRTPVGNPYPLDDEADRDKVCDKYDVWFNTVGLKDPKVLAYLNSLRLYLVKHKKIILLCWCWPKRCHGLTIKKWLETNHG